MSLRGSPWLLAIGFGSIVVSLSHAEEAPGRIWQIAVKAATPAPSPGAPSTAPEPGKTEIPAARGPVDPRFPAAPPRLTGEAARRVEAMKVKPEDLERDKAAALKKLKDDYRVRLDEFGRALKGDDAQRLAKAVEEEKGRLEADTLKVEDGSSPVPFEIVALRNRHLEKVAGVSGNMLELEVRNRAVALDELAAELAGKGDFEGVAAVRALISREQAELQKTKDKQAAPDLHRTAAAGSGEGEKFEEIGPNGALLVGFVVHTSQKGASKAITGLQPLFRSSVRTLPGGLHGTEQPEPARLEARPGYAVARVRVQVGQGAEGLGLTYMRLRPGGLGLEQEDTYESDWVGAPSVKVTTIGGGVPVRGIFGTAGKAAGSLGLLERGVQFDAKQEVAKENAATLEVANLFPTKLAAGPELPHGGWQEVPPFLDGATIYMGKGVAEDAANGVTVFKALTAGRVFLACNFTYQGNQGGGWSEERWTEQEFLARGWARVENAELVSYKNGHRTFIVFTKELKKDEVGRIRCNKYAPPFLITFQK